jgi:protein-tyrosine phosphatase
MQPEETLKLQKLVFDGTANLICEGVYLGSHLASMSELSLLKHLGITHILCVALETEYHPIHPLDIKYLHVKMYDSEKEDLLKHLSTSLNFMLSALSDDIDQKQSIDDVDIEAKTQKPHVLVVCRAGVSRSASVVIAWLMLAYHFSYQEAYKMTETSRPEICPNDGFVAQLKNLK